MESLPLHPALVHLPLALAFLMPLLSGVLLLAWWRDWLPKRTWVLAAAAQALLLAGGLVAMRTGESDEHRVERVVPERAIEKHEEAAEVFVWGSGAVLALALVPLLSRNVRIARIAALATTAGTIVVLALGYRVGEAGGELIYRHGAAAAFAPGSGAGTPAAAPAVRDTDDDDDQR